jgi:hypothetical protein
MQGKKLIATSAESATRVIRDRAEVTNNMNTAPVVRKIEGVTKPKSPRTTMRRAAIALIAAPDPLTTMAGVGLLATSSAIRNEPASLENLSRETRKIFRDLQSLSL